MSQKYQCEIEVDNERGVIYTHLITNGQTVLRICNLPKPIPTIGPMKEFLDITHMVGTNWNGAMKVVNADRISKKTAIKINYLIGEMVVKYETLIEPSALKIALTDPIPKEWDGRVPMVIREILEIRKQISGILLEIVEK